MNADRVALYANHIAGIPVAIAVSPSRILQFSIARATPIMPCPEDRQPSATGEPRSR